MTASLEEFSDLSDAGESNQFDIFRHKLQLAIQIFGGHAYESAIAKASNPLTQSTLHKKSSTLKRKDISLPVLTPPANGPTSTVSSSDVVPSTSMDFPTSVTWQSSSEPSKKKRVHNYAC